MSNDLHGFCFKEISKRLQSRLLFSSKHCYVHDLLRRLKLLRYQLIFTHSEVFEH